MSSLLTGAAGGESGWYRGVGGRCPCDSEPDPSSSKLLMSDDDIMKPKACMVGVGIETAIATVPTPAPPHSEVAGCCGSRPRTAAEPPGGESLLVALRWSGVKLVGWLAITLHC